MGVKHFMNHLLTSCSCHRSSECESSESRVPVRTVIQSYFQPIGTQLALSMSDIQRRIAVCNTACDGNTTKEFLVVGGMATLVSNRFQRFRFSLGLSLR